MSEAWINGLAGAGGGIIAQLLTYPLQTVNTRQQTERRDRDPSSESGASDRPSLVRQLILVVRNEGWERLYGGLLPSLVGTAASQGVYYYFYQIFRNRAESAALSRFKKGIGDGSIGMLGSLAIAAMAGCVNVLLTNPIWLLVARMQTFKKASKIQPPQGLPLVLDEAIPAAVVEHVPYKTSDAVQEVYKEAGLLGFWKGVVPSLVMVSNPAIQFMLYETVLQKLKKKRASNSKGAEGLSSIEIFFLGAVSKLGATLVTYPILVVKSRLQVKQRLGNRNYHYKGTLDAIAKMIKYEGIAGFYKGMGTKILQSVFAAAVLFMVKEELVKVVRLLVTGHSRPTKPLVVIR